MHDVNNVGFPFIEIPDEDPPFLLRVLQWWYICCVLPPYLCTLQKWHLDLHSETSSIERVIVHMKCFKALMASSATSSHNWLWWVMMRSPFLKSSAWAMEKFTHLLSQQDGRYRGSTMYHRTIEYLHSCVLIYVSFTVDDWTDIQLLVFIVRHIFCACGGGIFSITTFNTCMALVTFCFFCHFMSVL